MECRRIIGERHRYWNIKGWGHFVVFFCVNCISFRLLGAGRLDHMVAPLWHRFGKMIFHG
jgi:hypothetical protein